MILSAVNQEGLDICSVILVWDDRVLYNWLPQRDKQQAYSGANAMLIWHAIGAAMERGLIFDFDSFNSVGTARVLAAFGVPPTVRPAISHDNLLGLIRAAFRRHPRVNGIRPDSSVKISFGNAHSSKPGPACPKS